MVKQKNQILTKRLLANSRFWILALGVVLSVNIAGFVQLLIPSGTLQVIRLEQIYGFVSLLLLFIALLASPLTKLYPDLPFKDAYLHARRAIGVLTFYFALLHGWLAFFGQLGGMSGIKYYNSQYQLSLAFATGAFIILFLMAATSLDWAVRVMTFRRWKLLHRLVYFAAIAILMHAALIGSHFEYAGFLSILFASMAIVLVWLEVQRFYRNYAGKRIQKSRGEH